MERINIEIKARTGKTDEIREYILAHGADYTGTDIQTDTYFRVPGGRLKIRQGNIENSLIYYERENISGPRQSSFHCIPLENGYLLKELLTRALGIRGEVKKKREIFYLGNIKFHLDEVGHLGHFVEIEAGDEFGTVPEETLWNQCRYYQNEFGIREEDLVVVSYSDLLFSGEIT